MGRRGKLFERLDRLETELRNALIPALQRTAAGQDVVLFFTPETNPFPELRHKVSKEGAELFAAAQAILSLGDSLGVARDSLLAEKVVRSFHRATDLTNAHRPSPATAAQQLLEEISAME